MLTFILSSLPFLSAEGLVNLSSDLILGRSDLNPQCLNILLVFPQMSLSDSRSFLRSNSVPFICRVLTFASPGDW